MWIEKKNISTDVIVISSDEDDNNCEDDSSYKQTCDFSVQVPDISSSKQERSSPRTWNAKKSHKKCTHGNKGRPKDLFWDFEVEMEEDGDNNDYNDGDDGDDDSGGVDDDDDHDHGGGDDVHDGGGGAGDDQEGNHKHEDHHYHDPVGVESNKVNINLFFSPKKQAKGCEFNQVEPKKKHNFNIGNKSEKKHSNSSHKVSLADSPIARSFFAKMKSVQREWYEQVGASAPLLSHLNAPIISSSLQPRSFGTFQIDLLDSLAGDAMFYSAYIETVLAFVSKSIAPPEQVVMFIFSTIAQNAERTAALKAVNCLKRFSSMRVLTHRNFCITWDMLNDLVCRILKDVCAISCLTDRDSSSEKRSDLEESSLLPLFLFVVDLLEHDLKRYINNIRNCIIWKIMSPNIYGSSRLRILADWMTRILQTIENAEGTKEKNGPSEEVFKSNESMPWSRAYLAKQQPVDFNGFEKGYLDENRDQLNSKAIPQQRGSFVESSANENESLKDMVANNRKVFFTALHRLFTLTFLLGRDPKEESRVMADSFLNCFFELKTLRCRKMLLSNIESLLVQQITSELVLSTVYEDTSQSLQYKDAGKITLRTFVYGYFYMLPPYGTDRQSIDDNIELFVFLLFLLARSYLALQDSSVWKMLKPLSILGECGHDDFAESKGGPLSPSDRETVLYIKEEIVLLRNRLLQYRGSPELNDNAEMYLNLLSSIFDGISNNTTI